MATVRAYRKGDEIELAPRLRAADLMEIDASSSLAPVDCLREGGEKSAPSCTIIDEHDTPLAMFGVSDGGRVWLLGSDALVSGKTLRQFISQCRRYVDAIPNDPPLWNYIDARNEVHIRWLRWMGFTFIRFIPAHGPQGRAFYEFRRI